MIILNGNLLLPTEGLDERSAMGLFSSLERSLTGRVISTQSQFVNTDRTYTVLVDRILAKRLRQFAATTRGPFDFVDHEGFSWLTAAGSDDDYHAYATGVYFAAGQRFEEMAQQANGYTCDNRWQEAITFVVNARGWRGNDVSNGGTIDMTYQVPSGTINGINAVFTLSDIPVTLLLFRNGVLQQVTVDYNISGLTITFTAGNIPIAGDSLVAYYTT